MGDLLVVGFGGLLGAVSRYLTGRFLTTACPLPTHVATLVINTVGSLLLGYIVARDAAASSQAARWQLFLAVGFCGSFTTFSSWILDLRGLLQHTCHRSAAYHLLLSLFLGVAGFGLGSLLGCR